MPYKLIINSIEGVWSSQQILISSVFMFWFVKYLRLFRFVNFLMGRFVSIAKCVQYRVFGLELWFGRAFGPILVLSARNEIIFVNSIENEDKAYE